MWFKFKICFITVFIYLICQITYANTIDKRIDSLKVRLAKATNKIEQIEITRKLFEITNRKDIRQGLQYAEKFMELANDINADTLISTGLLNFAQANIGIGNYPRALDYFQQVIKSRGADSSIMLSAYNGIGVINYYQRDYESAANSYNKALTYFPAYGKANTDKIKVKRNLLNNLGILYESTNKLDKADYFYSESLKLSNSLHDSLAIAHTLTNHARLYHLRGRDSLALVYYKNGLEIRQRKNDKNGIAASYDGLGVHYFDLKEYELAEKYLKAAIKLAQETGDLLIVRRSTSRLYRIYQEQGKYKLAFEALALNKESNDSLFNDERTNRINQLKAQFEFEQKNSAAKAKQREKELKYLLIGVGLLLSLVIVSLLFYLQRTKIKRTMLEQAHLKLEKESLEKDIQMKDKELATSTIHLMQKNELIDDISAKLLKMKPQMDEDTKHAIQRVVTDLQSNLRPELLKEFEFRFQQVHEDFYDILNAKFPNLTPNERKLCAFLKLGMTTKEISAITYQNTKSIEIARTRLRKKLNLTNQDANLVTFLAQLS